MNLGSPPPEYDPDNEAQTRSAIEQADQQSVKRGQDIELGKGRVIIKSPNGARWFLTISNAGAVSATAL